MKVSIYGIGNFGYAILKHLDKYSNEEIFAYDENKEKINYLKKHRKHPQFHKNFKISKKINIVDNIEDLLIDSDILILALKSNFIREALKKCKPYLKNNKKIIILNVAKALDYKTGKPLSLIVKQELKPLKNYKYAVISGGTIARDLFMHEPLGADLASRNKRTLKTLKQLLQSETLNIYTTKDCIGVEYAGAFKNVISIFAGIIQGLGYSYGSETHIISKAGEEAGKIIVKKFRAKKQTFFIGSQCWGNDLWMSCTGKTRNKEFGKLIGEGKSVDEAKQIMKKQNKTVEGINTLLSLKKSLGSLKKYPYLETVYEIVINNEDPKIMIKKLFEKKD
ncbi:MAG: NAD(P)-binding domain-containing protein [Candidatus Woesearchaeota archaeon]